MSSSGTASSERSRGIQAIDASSVHRITSGQVVIDLQTAVKELVENSLDAGATNIEVRFKDYGLKSVEIIDNGSGVAPEDYDSVALKHHTSKLSSFADLTSVLTFGFRGEALSSLCALTESVSIITATAAQAPMGTVLTFDKTGRVTSRNGKVARQRGTTVTLTRLFASTPVRRKEFERHAKREFGKALHLLTAYALVPCTRENSGVVLTVSNTPDGGKKAVQLRTDGSPSLRAAVGALWGPKQLENLVELDLSFEVVPEKVVLRRQEEAKNNQVRVQGLISKFAPSAGRSNTDRQFFFINGRPCAPAKVQKAMNETYRTFNAAQSPFVVADFVIPTDSCDINVSPDKRTILLHSENNLIEAMKIALTDAYDGTRSNFVLNATQVAAAQKEAATKEVIDYAAPSSSSQPLFIPEEEPPDTHPPPPDMADNESGEPEVESIVAANHGTNLSGEVPTHLPPSPEKTHPEKRPREPSPGLPSDSETRPSKKLAATTPPSPVVPFPSTSQRLTGPGRTLARVEKIISEDVHAPRRPMQMVLDTSGASWNLKPGLEGPPRRRTHPGDASGSSSGKNARASMRAQLAGFARGGAKAVQAEEPDSPEEEDSDVEKGAGKAHDHEEMEVDELADDDEDEDDSQVVGDGKASTDVVDETMDVDLPLPNSDDVGAPKKPQDTSHNIDTQASPAPPRTANVVDLTLDEDQLGDSPAARTSSSSVVAETPQASSSKASDTPNPRTFRQEFLRRAVGDAPPLIFDLARTTAAWHAHTQRRSVPAPTARPSELQRADLGADDALAAAALARVLAKADFGTMEVIGQFNCGFIVARLRRAHADGGATDDLFIVDQHAADEKYNFETLQVETRLEAQRLFSPRVLELTAADELIALENMEVLQQNGFEVALDEELLAGRRLKLVAQPVSKNTEFGVQDLEEILHLLRDRPTGTLVRPSKVRAMFAMRACRKSTMIGAVLNAKQMTTVGPCRSSAPVGAI
ncbi:hypothetical protein BC834DRAFT_886174 [Gloeopeniophorella convolvens]|nr:hypothetical protein BC834DRAFT_886174 [Gloeopeniophorella convolvens]